MAIKTGTAQAVPSYWTGNGNIVWKRTGHVVSFSGQGNLNFSAITNGNTTTVIATGFPKAAITSFATLQILMNGAGAENMLSVNTNGELAINKSSSQDTGNPYVFIGGTYITTD